MSDTDSSHAAWLAGIRAGHLRVPAVLLLATLTLLVATPSLAQDKRNSNAVEAKFTAEGTPRCLRCHAGDRMLAMAETAHGNLDNADTPLAQHGCESCHGPGSLHVSRARGGIGFPALIVFDERDSAERQTGACLACHAKKMGELEGMEWTNSVHDTVGITCISCHEAHIVGNPLQEPEKQREACGTCHARQISAHRRFEDKGIVFDNLTCFDCHDVHQLIHEP